MSTTPRPGRRLLPIILLAAAALAVWFSPLDRPASESLDAGTKRAFITFAAARGLNAAISFLQGTEITAGFDINEDGVTRLNPRYIKKSLINGAIWFPEADLSAYDEAVEVSCQAEPRPELSGPFGHII